MDENEFNIIALLTNGKFWEAKVSEVVLLSSQFERYLEARSEFPTGKLVAII